MKTPERIIEVILLRIGSVYHGNRSLMYGGTPEGVDLLLHTYHVIWAEIVERCDDLATIGRAIYEEEDCGTMGFPRQYRTSHPNASDQEVAGYVVEQWRTISERLGMLMSETDWNAKIETDRPESWKYGL